jgi:tetratricopeptide (TPR) repeat protein
MTARGGSARWRTAAAAVAALAVAATIGGAVVPAARAEPDGGERAGGVAWYDGSFDEARARARAQDKLLLVDCWATWCQFCFEMDDEVWSRSDVAHAVDVTAVPLKAEVDARRGAGLELRRQYDVEGLPLVLIIDPVTGEALERLEGYQSAAAILAALDRAGEERLAAADVDPGSDDPAALAAAGLRLMRAGQPGEARPLLERAIELDADCAADQADDAAVGLADLLALTVGKPEALAVVEPLSERCREASAAEDLWRRRIDLAGEVEGEDARGAALARRAELYPQDWEALLADARWQFERGPKEAIPAAADGARRAAELAPEMPGPLALLARIAFYQERLDEALAQVERAIELDPHDTDLRTLRLRIALAQRHAP